MSLSGGPNLLTRVVDWLKAHVSSESELANMSYQDLQFLASDIGVSVADLRAIGPMITDHDDLLKQMLLQRGLDPDAVRRAFGGVMRDMEITCARCHEVGVCQRELKANTAAAHCHEFCGNAEVMDDLQAVKPPHH
jgi:hypothetical protein